MSGWVNSLPGSRDSIGRGMRGGPSLGSLVDKPRCLWRHGMCEFTYLPAALEDCGHPWEDCGHPQGGHQGTPREDWAPPGRTVGTQGGLWVPQGQQASIAFHLTVPKAQPQPWPRGSDPGLHAQVKSEAALFR